MRVRGGRWRAPFRATRLACALALIVGAVTGCGGSNGEPEDATDIDNDPLQSISVDELYRRGMLLAQAGDYVRAEQYLAASLDRGFAEERALPALLNVCIRASRMVAALEYAEPYLARHPEQWPLRLLVGTIHMGLSEPERARTEFERVLVDAAPEEPPEAHYFLGVVFRDSLSDADAAGDHFRRYLALAPEGPHGEEARAALSQEERGLPTRVDREDVPPVEPPDPESPEEELEDDEAAESPETVSSEEVSS
ncbi:MAG: tetratricopeptide repeat protein [Sandaracinaceae bacterium]